MKVHIEPEGKSFPHVAKLRTQSKSSTQRHFSLHEASLRFCILIVFLLFGSSASAQYSIDWFTSDGGGGTSTGGVYSVSGTIGQPDASGPMTNGPYAITGGFWALPTAVQTPNAPILHIGRSTPGLAIISWSPATPGFVLQESVTWSPFNWTNSASGTTNPAVVPATLPIKYYRLFKP